MDDHLEWTTVACDRLAGVAPTCALDAPPHRVGPSGLHCTVYTYIHTERIVAPFGGETSAGALD